MNPWRVAVALSAAAGCACGASVEPRLELTKMQSSPHYTFHMAPADSVDVVWQEAYIAWLLDALAVELSEPLEYFKYLDRTHLARMTGRETNGFAEPGTSRFHTIWPVDNHEGVHTVVILEFGHPPALFNEGVAVAHQTAPFTGDLVARWNGQNLHALAAGFIRQQMLPSLGELVESDGFFRHNQDITYPAAGSFVRYLLDMHGLPSFTSLLAGSSFDDGAATTLARVDATYGQPLTELWAAWQAWLEQEF